MKIIKMTVLGSFAMFLALGFHNPQFSDFSDSDTNNTYRKVENKAFKPGEVLNFKIHYGLIDAGEARLEVRKPKHKISGRELIHVVGTGKSRGAFDWFFKVRDRYESYLDEEGVFPWLFIRDIQEGGYSKTQNYKFYQNKKKVVDKKGNIYDVPFGVQDMLSAFYYARTMNMKALKPGDTVKVTSFMDDEIYPLMIKYVGKEVIDIRMGKFRCMKFNTIVQEGRVFKANEDLAIFITDDENKIPILGQVKVLVGSIKMELTSYSGLANPISKVN